ncbi:ferritin-like domain-containing protein [Bacillus carboniphilus]|uniref:Ferritin-like domain-containing protein n=1 Tax=Bacillus carboniphilus TaxID=86663 RepID=A0ABY9JUJ2_9BACI|nr:ferritin-like domain-containing protein [Bacillus carboniphilus]WLR42464.1 ferritin-like domain-containing protein [Bacillus carboniphilus]
MYQYGRPDFYYYQRLNQSVQQAANLIQEAVQGERKDEQFYNYLISVAPTAEEKDIITSIRNDEMKHNQLFRDIYRNLTGQEVQTNESPSYQEPKSYLAGIKEAFFGELSAVEDYRKIRAFFQNFYYRDILYEIITDEQKHADKYNFILNKNIAKKVGINI